MTNRSQWLAELESQWRQEPIYTDVKAMYYNEGVECETRCPQGCALTVYEGTNTGWARIPDRDAYRKTMICQEHGYARIYAVTGPDAKTRKSFPKLT